MSEPMSSRFITLRRPPVLVMESDRPFVPQQISLREVDQRWAEFYSTRPQAFDGRVSHVLGVHRNGHGGASIHLADCAYRFYAVQSPDLDLGVRPLGVKAIIQRGSKVLMGKRADWVKSYAGLWECAPGGGVPPCSKPGDVIREELTQETGLVASHEPTAVAILFDPLATSWEIVYRMAVQDDDLKPHTDEYAELRWCHVNEMPNPLSPVTQRMFSFFEPSVNSP